MSNIAIHVSNITKKFELYNKPIDRLKEALHPLRRIYHQDFYALKGLTFEIKKGQTVGIVGKNGSGKSTLLKILTGVLTPTSGEVVVNGKVAALLELGAGFNPELTGIENVYLSGALIGYTKDQMDALMPNIVDFADIGQFLYQPVKMFSSGMFARLAFAVSINVDPDILIIDEALSVGDIRFQQKCIRRLNEFKKSGRTVIFVSHDTVLLSAFCDSAIWIHEGSLKEFGQAKAVTNLYSSYMSYSLETNGSSKQNVSMDKQENKTWWPMLGERLGSGSVDIGNYRFIIDGNPCEFVEGGEDVEMQIQYNVLESIDMPILGVMFKNKHGVMIFGVNNVMYEHSFGVLNPGSYIGSIKFKMPILANGEYSVSFSIANGTQENHEQLQWIHDAILLQISKSGIKYNIGALITVENAYFSNTLQ